VDWLAAAHGAGKTAWCPNFCSGGCPVDDFKGIIDIFNYLLKGRASKEKALLQVNASGQ